jgi:hypothetical protein
VLGALLNYELWIVSCLVTSGHRLLLAPDCQLSLRGVLFGGTVGYYHSQRQDVILAGKEETLVTSKNGERRGNVIENKGPLWKKWGGSGNVIENKGSYALKAGMLVKTKRVDGMSQVVGGEE